MGGRGSNSMDRVGGQRTPKKEKKIEDFIERNGLTWTIKGSYIQVPPRVVDLLGTADRVESVTKAVTDTMALFNITDKEIRVPALTAINSGDLDTDTYAEYNPGVRDIFLDISHYKDWDRLKRQYEKDVADGFHPKGTTADDIIAHETGHAIAHMVGKAKAQEAKKKGDVFAAIDYEYDWTWDKEVVSEACKNVKKTAYGKGKKNGELKRSLSKYASNDRKPYETLAEGVADYRANGDKANPLSIEIVKIMRRDMDALRRGGYL